MNKIILFIIFILLGVFIYYTLKEQCKCNIVEGQGRFGSWGMGTVDDQSRSVDQAIQSGHLPDVSTTAISTALHAAGAENLINDCSPFNYFPISGSAIDIAQCINHIYDKINKDPPCNEDTGECNGKSHKEFFNSTDEKPDPLLISYGFKKVLDKINDSIVNNDNDYWQGICFDKTDDDLNNCLKDISNTVINNGSLPSRDPRPPPDDESTPPPYEAPPGCVDDKDGILYDKLNLTCSEALVSIPKIPGFSGYPCDFDMSGWTQEIGGLSHYCPVSCQRCPPPPPPPPPPSPPPQYPDYSLSEELAPLICKEEDNVKQYCCETLANMDSLVSEWPKIGFCPSHECYCGNDTLAARTWVENGGQFSP